MKTYGLIGLMLGLAACTPAQPPVTEAMVQGHVAAATNAAGSDLQQMLSLCKPAPATSNLQNTFTWL